MSRMYEAGRGCLRVEGYILGRHSEVKALKGTFTLRQTTNVIFSSNQLQCTVTPPRQIQAALVAVGMSRSRVENSSRVTIGFKKNLKSDRRWLSIAAMQGGQYPEI